MQTKTTNTKKTVKQLVDKKTEPVKHHKRPRVSRRPRVTKKARQISLLSKKSGVDVGILSKKLGWQTHSTRSAMSGLRKSGYGIELIKSAKGKPARYHISSVPTEQSV